LLKLRDWQEKLKGKVVEALRSKKVVLLNAPTGSGKTLFSLLVGFELFDRVIAAVKTHNEFFPYYREAKRLERGSPSSLASPMPVFSPPRTWTRRT